MLLQPALRRRALTHLAHGPVPRQQQRQVSLGEAPQQDGPWTLKQGTLPSQVVDAGGVVDLRQKAGP